MTFSLVSGARNQPLKMQTIGQAFETAAANHAECDALIVPHQGIRWSCREFKRQVDEFAAGLAALGLVRGDRLGIWAPNCAEWAVTQFASASLGVILVNINPAYRLVELEFCLNKVGCRALVAAERLNNSDYFGMLRTLAPELDSCPPTNCAVPDCRNCAWIQLNTDCTATEEEFRDYCRGRIAHYKIPRYIRLVAGFPMTVTGKVQKDVMRETMKELLGLSEQPNA